MELDVRASHLFILYALQGQEMDPEADPYFLPGVEREVVKGLFTAMTGQGGRPSRFPKALAKNYLAKTGRKIGSVYNLGKLLDALMAKYPVLAKLKRGSLDWARLQYEESECFMECLLRLGREFGIAALPIHDSLIVAKAHEDMARTILVCAYAARFGFDPEVRGE
ncbi:hypothetical protein [Rhodobacter maris]|uniref:Uncharacterized protein n=1 Tax=Rhodobacter maris TaxID=446682 RepID=A0A285THE5_9RHOB|nr:hypothetical protein [Rhodobacter maris]SOC21377.1 hypothetical protein SAMN05877831_1235 [Rhodobacter maris]